MRRVLPTIVMVGCLHLMIVEGVRACSGAPSPPPRQAMNRADAVFTGEVIRIEVEEYTKRVTFSADRTWKGVTEKTISIRTPRDGAACGYGFQKGGRYLVYAWDTWNGLYTGICSRTRTMEEAENDLKALGNGHAPEAQKRVAEHLDTLVGLYAVGSPMPIGLSSRRSTRKLDGWNGTITYDRENGALLLKNRAVFEVTDEEGRVIEGNIKRSDTPSGSSIQSRGRTIVDLGSVYDLEPGKYKMRWGSEGMPLVEAKFEVIDLE